mmetsp:Transcript_23389/g.35449  ORF Transcript_23389/g.35449 Transcript_23389/m.35449 type:complete len:105 (-) Transcript_23389:3811-4125(-)
MAIRIEKTMKNLNLPPACASMGPFPLQDDWGMKEAIGVLDKSLDPGKYEETVQAETFQKIRSAITNIHQASAGGMGDVVGAFERKRVWISSVPTHSFGFPLVSW